MVSIVSERFVQVVLYMKSKGVIKSYRQFASDIDYFPQGMNAILKGEREVSVELIRKTALMYSVNLDFIFNGKGHMFNNALDETSEQDFLVIKVPFILPNQIPFLAEFYTNGKEFTTQNLQVPSTWFFKENIFAFQITKDGMSPALNSGDLVFCSEVDISQLRFGIIYGILWNSEIVFYRYNKQYDGNSLIFTQDGVADSEINIGSDEILKLFEVEHKVTSVFTIQNKFATQISKDLQYLQLNSEEQLENMKNLNKSIEILLKQLRQSK